MCTQRERHCNFPIEMRGPADVARCAAAARRATASWERSIGQLLVCQFTSATADLNGKEGERGQTLQPRA